MWSKKVHGQDNRSSFRSESPGFDSPLAPLVEDAGALGAMSLVALQLVETVASVLFGLSVLKQNQKNIYDVKLECKLPPLSEM